MKKLFAISLCLTCLSYVAHAQLPADPWRKNAPQKPEPVAETAPKTFDNNLPINPWPQAKPSAPIKKQIPKIDGLSINPIKAGTSGEDK